MQPLLQRWDGIGPAKKCADIKQVGIAALVAEAYGRHFVRQQLQRQEPAGAAGRMGGRVAAGPDDSVFRQRQPELFVQFAQGADGRAFIALTAAARQIDQVRPGDGRLVVAAIDQDAAIDQAGQLGAGEIAAVPDLDQGCTAWA